MHQPSLYSLLNAASQRGNARPLAHTASWRRHRAAHSTHASGTAKARASKAAVSNTKSSAGCSRCRVPLPPCSMRTAHIAAHITNTSASAKVDAKPKAVETAKPTTKS